MSQLQLAGLRKRYGAQDVLRGVDLAVAAGTVTALLGASGCGKTTLLRLVAGFDRVDGGTIAVGGQAVAGPGLHVPPERRRIGYVPQEGALFPHLTVAGNVGYGLDRAARRGTRVDQVLRMTGLQDLAGRYPSQLSGGQQQRTALARALAPRPSLVLLDEPFNALDRELRLTVCAEVTAALHADGATAILVTHDPEEAFASAGQVAVMRAGLIVQCGTPESVYRAPVDVAAARLTGPVLVLAGAYAPGGVLTALGLVAAGPGAGPATVLVRPEQVVLDPDGTPALVTAAAFRGGHTLLSARIGDLEVPVRITGTQGCAPGGTVRLRVQGHCAAVPG